MTRPIPLFVVALLLVLSGCGKPAATPPAEPAEIAMNAIQSPVDREAPDLTLVGLDGAPLQLASLKGKVLLVNFWATWCAPCREEIPDLIALQDKLGDEAFAVIGVASILYDEEVDEVRAFVADNGMDYPIVLDKGPAGEAFGGVFALPTTYIIDRQFVVRHRTIGMPDASLEPLITELIAAD
ncbi:MAG: TlpA disulfide reductase family protein [Rhodothermales bacterium]